MKLIKTMLSLSAGLLALAAISVVQAENTPATQPTTRELLGDEFRSPATGIAFRPPVDCTKVTTSVPDQIVEFDNDQRHWVFKASKVSLGQPLPLADFKDPYGTAHEGLLELTAKRLEGQPGADVLVKQIVHVGAHGEIAVGMLAARYDAGNERRLLQQAIVEATNQLYYVIDLDSPSARGLAQGAVSPDEALASNTFNQLLDSVRLLDRGAIRQDQVDRLLRTRGLYANWTPRYLESRLIPEQYFRLIRDGKDVGYTYEIEEVDSKEGRIGDSDVIKVLVRSHSVPDVGTTVDTQSSLITAVDQKHEKWANVAEMVVPANAASGAIAGQPTGKPTAYEVSEVGASDSKFKAVVAAPAPGAVLEPEDPEHPQGHLGIQMEEGRLLTVTRWNKLAQLSPFRTQTAAFYLPQALSHMLPRLLPYKEAHTYLFETYVADGKEGQPALMLRYIDVLAPDEVELNGRKIVAIAVKDHVGLEGPVTTHYLNPENGSYLGSVSMIIDKDKKTSTIMILPTDKAALVKLWGNPNLTRPTNTLDQAPPDDADAR